MDPYVQQLIEAVRAALPGWLERCVTETAIRSTGACPPALRDAAAMMATRAATTVMNDLTELLGTDVDRQATNPLSVLRAAVVHPTAVLAAHAVPEARRDDFAIRAFPTDVYGLSPATWADVDESLREPGLLWGAWKAKTVLDRRRAEGLGR